MSLNIGAFACAFGMGGSQNSAVSICNALIERGHRVTLYCPARQSYSHQRPRFDLVDLPLCRAGVKHFVNVSAANIRKAVAEARRRRHDALLAFNSLCLFAALPLTLLDGTACVAYVLGPRCGPPLPVFPFTVVANSEETRGILAEGLGRRLDEIPVVRARVNLKELDARRDAGGLAEALLPPPGVSQIVMMSPFRSIHMTAIGHVLDALGILAAERSDFRLLLAGDGLARAEVEAKTADLNARCGREVARVVGYVSNVASFLAAADIALGIGRCAFEPMALGRATLVVGARGYAGTVSPEDVADLARFNFAGRNVAEMPPPEVLAGRLRALLDDPGLRARLGAFARSYVVDHLDVGIGARQFEQILEREQARPRLSAGGRALAMGRYLTYLLFWTAKGAVKHALWPDRGRPVFEKLEELRRTRGESCLMKQAAVSAGGPGA